MFCQNSRHPIIFNFFTEKTEFPFYEIQIFFTIDNLDRCLAGAASLVRARCETQILQGVQRC